MTGKQLAVTIICLAVVCSGLVWLLERFNRELLIRQFAEQLANLPTAVRDVPPAG